MLQNVGHSQHEENHAWQPTHPPTKYTLLRALQQGEEWIGVVPNVPYVPNVPGVHDVLSSGFNLPQARA